MLDAFETSPIKVKQKTVVSQVMEEIKELITRDSLQPGDKLPSESDLASMFNISRSSIREALKIYQFLGIVETAGPKGKIISGETRIASETINWSLLLASPSYPDLLELRLAMEEQGLWYMEVFKKDDRKLHETIINRLEEEVENMRRIHPSKPLEHRLTADFNFHGHIVGICRNPIFNSVYENLRHLMLNQLMKILDSEKQNSLFADPDSHMELIKVIKNGDYTESFRAFRKHVVEVEICNIKQ